MMMSLSVQWTEDAQNGWRQPGAQFLFTEADLNLSIEDFGKRYLLPCLSSIAERCKGSR